MESRQDPYKPIACSVYDVLESAAVLRSPLLIVMFNDRQVRVLVKDVFAKGSEEFLKVADADTGEEYVLRLDKITRIIDPSSQRTYISEQC